MRVLSAAGGLVLGLGGCQTLERAPAEHVYPTAAVAADHVVASEAGVEMLRQGGNAVDAAVATSFALSVVRPYSCGIGGGGFMIIHEPGRDGAPSRQVALNYRETAPAAIDADYYVRLEGRADAPESPSRFGPHASGVPGTVAGLLHALEHHGTLDRATVLAPAIRAAEDGFLADRSWVAAAEALAEKLAAHPELAEQASYLTRTLCLDGRVRIGDRVRNPDQARVLRRIAEHGRDGFYAGPVADALVGVSRAQGGPLTHADLAGYRVRVMEPLRGAFRGRTILSMPPPSSGGVAMQQIAGILERRWPDLSDAGHNGPAYVHLVAEAMKHAFADRAQWLADADFVEVPVARLLEPAYVTRLADGIDLETTRERFAYGSVAPAPDDAGTSHLSVVDGNGMAVACTETINLVYGSLVVVPGFGFALNDEMDDFTTIPGAPNAFGLQQSYRNLPAPGKRPLSSMSPTIVLDDGEVVLVAGASGGPRIISGTVQTMLNCLVFDMSAAEAVAAPRFHHQWMPEAVFLEEPWADGAIADALRSRGHEVRPHEGIGVVQLVLVRRDGVHAASDPRKGGSPAGY